MNTSASLKHISVFCHFVLGDCSLFFTLILSGVCVCLCRNLLCSLVRVKLSCYEMENQCSLSVEDYLKAFLENEVKPLWPKGWMQTRSVLLLCVQLVTSRRHLSAEKCKLCFKCCQSTINLLYPTLMCFPFFSVMSFLMSVTLIFGWLCCLLPVSQDLVQGEPCCSQSPHWKPVSVSFVSPVTLSMQEFYWDWASM